MFGRQRKSQCEITREMFSPYLDSCLTELEQDAVKFHLEVCESCRHELASLESMAKLLRRMPVVAVPRSFTLGEAHARHRPVLWGIPEMNLLRVGAAVSIVLLAIVLAFDFTGTFSIQPSNGALTKTEASVPGEGISSLPVNTLAPSTESAGSEGIPEAISPNESSYTGIASLDDGSIPETGLSGPVSNVPEAEKVADPSGAGEVVSPTPPPYAPSWLYPLEIASGILVAILGGLNLWVWQRKRQPFAIYRK